jgi:hypothetical protein
MRSRLIGIVGKAVDKLRKPPTTPSKPPIRSTQRVPAPRPAAPKPGMAPRRDGVQIDYTPAIDGDPDPGEVVWTWVAYEDDPSQGKDRPVVIIGRHGRLLAGVALTSKQHDNERQVAVGSGPWDREGRTSYAKVERILDVDPAAVRREGAILSRRHFDDIVAALR